MQQPKSLGNAETHWSRVLHYDLFSANGDDKEISVATDGPNDYRSPRRGGSPVHTAATRLAIFIAIYTAVAFAVHFMFWPDAAAIVPDAMPTTASTAPVLDSMDDSDRVNVPQDCRAGTPAESSMSD
jgi:hypothetical protein